MKNKRMTGLFTAAVLCAAIVPTGAAPESELPALQPEATGEYATVLDAAGDGSLLAVQTDTYDELHLGMQDALCMDDVTGAAASLSGIGEGDEIYVYYAPEIRETDPPQGDAVAVLVNPDEGHTPARLLTAGEVTRNADGSLSVLAENGKIWVTLPADVPVSPLGTKNLVSLADIQLGTRFFAWYDAVAESYPAQAAATRVVIPPQTDSSFSITVEGDMVLPVSGRVENGTAMVPVRATAETLGYMVGWDGAGQRVTLSDAEGIACVFRLDTDDYVFGDGDSMALGAAAYEVNGASWAPAQLFALLGEPVALREGTLQIGTVTDCGIPNPMVDAEDASAFADTLGFSIDAPAGASDVQYSIIGGQVAQVTFSADDAAYVYRAARTTEDISGVYPKPGFTGLADGMSTMALPEGGFVGGWMHGDIQYLLVTYDLSYDGGQQVPEAFEDMMRQLYESTRG